MGETDAPKDPRPYVRTRLVVLFFGVLPIVAVALVATLRVKENTATPGLSAELRASDVDQGPFSCRDLTDSKGGKLFHSSGCDLKAHWQPGLNDGSRWKICNSCTAEEAYQICNDNTYHCEGIQSPDKGDKKSWYAAQRTCWQDTFDEDGKFYKEFCINRKHDWTLCILEHKVDGGACRNAAVFVPECRNSHRKYDYMSKYIKATTRKTKSGVDDFCTKPKLFGKNARLWVTR